MESRSSRSIGRAHVGGPFEMVTHDGKPFTDKRSAWEMESHLLHFGFTNCPDMSRRAGQDECRCDGAWCAPTSPYD
jgi:SCO1/SenC